MKRIFHERRILIAARIDSMGSLVMWPVSAKHRQKFVEIVRENGGPSSDTILIQNDYDVDLFVGEQLTERAARDLRNGYEARFLMTPWQVGMYYGYDAHNADIR